MKKVLILGTGCPKCVKLKEQTEAAAKELGLDCQIEKVTNVRDITSFGVMVTPALVVEGDVKVTGRVPDIAEIKRLLL